jgi:hypothetical protein
MKLFTRTLSLLVLASLTLFFANCGGDDPKKAAEEEQLDKLSQTWDIVSADLDGTDRTADFANFDLIISGSFDPDEVNGDSDYPYDFSVSGSRPTPNPWPASGTWEFSATPDGNSGMIERNDGIGMFYSIDGNDLTITFNFSGTGYPGAKTAQVNGDWTFVFN